MMRYTVELMAGFIYFSYRIKLCHLLDSEYPTCSHSNAMKDVLFSTNSNAHYYIQHTKFTFSTIGLEGMNLVYKPISCLFKT